MNEDLVYPPPPRQDWAYFLDFDGTLVKIADRPEGVRIKQELVELLARLDQVTKGAVVLVSGRSISVLDSFLAPLKLRAAGLHGLEYRLQRNGMIERGDASREALDPVRPQLMGFAARDEGIQIEDKGLSLAIHFRRAPDQETAARRAAEEACRVLGPAFACLAGKMVYEIKPRRVHKGLVLETFMKAAAFCGRRTVFVGDDVTDEDGFDACNALGGVSVRVGASDRPTAARFGLADVQEVEDWLGQVVETVEEARL